MSTVEELQEQLQKLREENEKRNEKMRLELEEAKKKYEDNMKEFDKASKDIAFLESRFAIQYRRFVEYRPKDMIDCIASYATIRGYADTNRKYIEGVREKLGGCFL